MIELIKTRLEDALAAVAISIDDESALHAGHVGARGGGHFRLRLISQRFENLSRIARHRLVYDALFDLMRTQIHALTICALTPAESAAAREAEVATPARAGAEP